jgi:acetyltransferase EpsM
VVAAGASVAVDAVLALLLDKPGPLPEQRATSPTASAAAPGAPRLTERARVLAEQAGIDFARLPIDRIVREADVQALLDQASVPIGRDPRRRVAIYGASQGGRAVADCLLVLGGFEVALYLDDTPGLAGASFEGRPIWSGDRVQDLAGEGVGAVATHIANRPFRLTLRDRVAAYGLQLLTIVHPRAFVSPTARLGVGCLVKAGAVVDAGAALGDCCIVDNGAIVAHDARIGDGCHLAPGATLAGDCHIGPRALIGTGAALSAHVRIGSDAIVTPGAVVVRDVPNGTIVEGNPAREIGRVRV